jgi:glycosyltransferase involved in cell wall biosynthesis
MKENLGILIATGLFGPDIGGPASYAHTLASRLSVSSPVTVVTYSSVRSLPEDAKSPYKIVRVWRGWPKGLRHIIFFFIVCKYARQVRVVFALNAVSAGFPSRLAARMYKRKFIVKIVGDVAWERAISSQDTLLMLNDFQKSNHRGWAKTLHAIQFQVCKGAHAVIVPSEYLGQIVQGWGIPPEKIKVIYNGTDFQPSTLSKEEARKKLGITGNVILSAGRLVPWKGFRMLIKIAPKLASINHFFQIIIVGDGPDRANLEAIIRNMGLERKVQLVGKKSRKELADYLAAADLFILNTGYEGFSHQVLEVMAAGVPLITTNAGGNKEIIHQGQNGFMVKYNDEFNLIEVIRTLWSSSEIQERFIEEGKKTAHYFSAQKMFDETISLLLAQ